MYLGDEITLQLKVDGAQDRLKLLFPNVEGLSFRQLGSPGVLNQTTIVNGEINSFKGAIYTIGITASKNGSYVIPGIKVEYNSQIYKGNPFKLRVTLPHQQNEMRLVTTVSTTRVYIQQPLDITLKWYVQDNVNDYDFRFPLLNRQDELHLELVEPSVEAQGDSTQITLNGFKIPFQQREELFEGQEYTTLSVTLRIYPQAGGELLIPTATVKAKVKVGTTLQRDFFDRMIRVPKLKTLFTTSPQQVITVLSPPLDGRPESYTGAVGQFNIQLISPNTRVKVGDPIKLVVKISGSGQLQNITAPLLSENPLYQSGFVIVDNFQPGDIQDNSILFTQTIRAKSSEIKEIPAINFSYFDPLDEKYHQLKSNTIPLKVLPAKRVQLSDIIVNNKQAPLSVKQGLKEFKQGIRGNYTFAEALEPGVKSWEWLIVLILPPMIYFLVLVLVNRRRSLTKNQALVRAKSARGIKNKRLREAKKLLEQGGTEFYLELSNSISGFIADRLNLGKGESTLLDLRKLKREELLPEELVDELMELMEEFERCRFMNLDTDLESRRKALKSVQDILKRIEKNL